MTQAGVVEPSLVEVGRWFLQMWEASLTTKVREVRVARLALPGMQVWRVDYCAHLYSHSYDHTAVIYLHNNTLHIAASEQEAVVERSTAT